MGFAAVHESFVGPNADIALGATDVGFVERT
jgi:hypothetical protein